MTEFDRKIWLIESNLQKPLKKTHYEKKSHRINKDPSFLCSHHHSIYEHFNFNCCNLSFPCEKCHKSQCQNNNKNFITQRQPQHKLTIKRICGFCGLSSSNPNMIDKICEFCLRNKKIESECFGKIIKRTKNVLDKSLCEHRSGKFIFLKFECCSGIFPCQLCHDLVSDHEAAVHKFYCICGSCKKEIFLNNEKCWRCGYNLKIIEKRKIIYSKKKENGQLEMAAEKKQKWKKGGFYKRNHLLCKKIIR